MKIRQSMAALIAASAVLLSGSVAYAGIQAQETPTREEALAALDHAQQDINTARQYINSIPTTTPPPPPPTTTTPPPPTTTQPPPPPTEGTTAAARHGWGTPIPLGTDEFNYTGRPDSTKWNYAGECWAGHDGNGKRCASRSNVANGSLIQTGLANGDSAWLGSKFSTRYGRWEARIKTTANGPNNGRQYHPLLLIWPESNRWPDHGEYDFFENSAPEAQYVQAFLHYPGHTPKRQESARKNGVDTSEWQNIAFEWTPTHLKGYINGEQFYSFSGADLTEMPRGSLKIQLDNFYGGNMQPASYEIDWVRTYALG